MEDAKRWSVTYTKHMKQKRKSYQDGFLELHAPSNKLLLFDDGGKLLECRILKKDEVISCGETLAFNAYLIDVNGAEGDHEAPPASNLIRRGNRSAEKNRSHRPNLSPSQKIISDFKKREQSKYEAIQGKAPDTTKSSTTEWEVLYTTQITQKAKKYHDGFVQLSIRGSTGRQLMLFDANRNTLDSKFLKKDEKIESGTTITFDAHLVEIGEPQGDRKSFGENNSSVYREKEIMHQQQNFTYRKHTFQEEFIKSECHKCEASHNSRDMTESSATEWKVLYTSQLTQKSKKYHDGFLQLAICGSRGRQALLYDASRRLLHSKFLKKEEVIRTGVSLAFDAYLVDVGEPDGNNEAIVDLTAQGKSCNVVKDTGNMHKHENSLTSNKCVLKEKSRINSCLKKDAESDFSISNIDAKEPRSTAPINKPLRDARQILSFLQKPRTQKSTPADYTNNNMTPTMRPLVSNSADLNFPEDDQPPKLSVPQDQSSENVDATTEARESIGLDKPLDIISSKTLSSSNGNQLAKHIENKNSPQQLYSDSNEVDTKWSDGAKFPNMPSFTTASCGPFDDEKNRYEEDLLKCARDMDECPSFDLGF